jgi:flavodoxin
MKSIVIYYSKSGNTQKVAQAVAAGLKAEAKRIDEINSSELAKYDLVVFGSPVWGGKPAAPLAEFISLMPRLDGKKVGVFCTKSLFGDKSTLAAMKLTLEDKGAIHLGGFCATGWSRFVGNFGPRIFHRGHPSPSELAKAEEFGRRLLSVKK